MNHDVFISYSTHDSPRAEAVYERLEADGIQCWMDEHNIPGGAEWLGELEYAVEACRVFVVILSAHANASNYVTDEVIAAKDYGKPIITYRIEDVRPNHNLRMAMRRYQMIDAWTLPHEQHLDRLAQGVARYLENDEEAPTMEEERRKYPTRASSEAVYIDEPSGTNGEVSQKESKPSASTEPRTPTDVLDEGEEPSAKYGGLERHHEFAENGDAIAQYQLGLMYRNGKGVEANTDMAEKWIRTAAEQGNANAQYEIGAMLEATYFPMRTLPPRTFPSNLEAYIRRDTRPEPAELPDAERVREVATWYVKAAVQGHVVASEALRRFGTQHSLVDAFGTVLPWNKWKNPPTWTHLGGDTSADDS